MRRSEFLAALLVAGLAAGHAHARGAVTVVTWGGAYEAAQRAAIFDPFTAGTGIEVGVRRHDGRPETLRARSGPEAWDVVDLTEDQAIAACESGLLRRLDHDAILEPVPETSLEADFAAGAFRDCSVAQNAFASVIAYNDAAFPGAKPGRVEDFFDLEAFPGKRAVERSPDAILEWALLAEGIPPSQVYDLLSTPRGLRLAFRKLDTIRDSIVWWTDVAETERAAAERPGEHGERLQRPFLRGRARPGRPDHHRLGRPGHRLRGLGDFGGIAKREGGGGVHPLRHGAGTDGAPRREDSLRPDAAVGHGTDRARSRQADPDAAPPAERPRAHEAGPGARQRLVRPHGNPSQEALRELARGQSDPRHSAATAGKPRFVPRDFAGPQSPPIAPPPPIRSSIQDLARARSILPAPFSGISSTANTRRGWA